MKVFIRNDFHDLNRLIQYFQFNPNKLLEQYDEKKKSSFRLGKTFKK